MLVYVADARVYAASSVCLEVDGALRSSSYAGALHNPGVVHVITLYRSWLVNVVVAKRTLLLLGPPGPLARPSAACLLLVTDK